MRSKIFRQSFINKNTILISQKGLFIFFLFVCATIVAVFDIFIGIIAKSLILADNANIAIRTGKLALLAVYFMKIIEHFIL